MMTVQDIWLLSPELAMAGVALAVIGADLVLNDKRQVALFAVGALVLPLLFALNLWSGWFGDTSAASGVFDTVAGDRFAVFFHFLLIGISAAVILASVKYSERLPGLQGELIGLMLLSVTGMMLLVSARELITIYVSLELTALPVAALAAFRRDNRSIEAGIKFLVLSAVSSAVLLFGIVFVYGYTGSTHLAIVLERLGELAGDSSPFGSRAVLFGIVMIVAGFGFKMAIVPWQMWVPDVYQGSPTPVSAFLSTASKASAFAVVIRILYAAFGSDDLMQDWSGFFAILAAVTMTFGNLAALGQSNIKRLLAYSTVAQAGYMLVGVAAVSANATGGFDGAGPQAVLYYLAGYAFTNLAVFFAVIAVSIRVGSTEISAFNGLGRRAPLLGVLLTVGVISLLGIPPTVGFMSKVAVFGAAVNTGMIWLAVVGVINSFVSAYYYLKIVRAIFFEEAEDESRITADVPVMAVTTIAAAGAIVMGAAPWPLLRLAEEALTIL